jgi:inorganic pyrophosphatase
MPEYKEPANLLDEMGRKDYIFVVGKLKEKFKDENIRMEVAKIFIDMFKQDNERFDTNKFLAAAGLKPLSEANKVVDKAKWEQLKKRAAELGLDPS